MILHLFSFLALHISFPIFSLKPNGIPSFIHMPLMLGISLKLIQTCSSFFEGMRETNVVSTLPLNSVVPSLEQNMKKSWHLNHFKRCKKPPHLSYWHVERRNMASDIKLSFLSYHYTPGVLLWPQNSSEGKPHWEQMIFPPHACTNIYHFYVSMPDLNNHQCWVIEYPGILPAKSLVAHEDTACSALSCFIIWSNLK